MDVLIKKLIKSALVSFKDNLVFTHYCNSSKF